MMRCDAACSNLKRRNEEVEASLLEEGNRRRNLEVSLADERQQKEKAETALRDALSRSDASTKDVIKSLRSELRSQEADIAEARKTKDRVK